jgi:hypothetical protein
VVTVFFPLDERLGLGEQSWSPATVSQILRVGVEVASYERAAALFRDFTHLPLSKSSMHRLVNHYGQVVGQTLEEEAMATVQVPSQEESVTWRTMPEPDSPMMNVSSDGVLIHIIDEGWKEVKIAAISAVTATVDAETGEMTVGLTQHSYRAGLWEASKFAPHLWAESCRRGLEKAKHVVSVNDGAPWIWAIVFMCFARCIQILDWWHAVERLWTIAGLAFGTDRMAATAWVKTQKELLAQSNLRQVLRNIRTLFPRKQPVPQAVVQAAVYFLHNRQRMFYQEFRQAGCPIGSGTVESACKLVVQQRMKQSGMRWSRSGAQAMLALRSVLLSQRWSLVHDTLAPA